MHRRHLLDVAGDRLEVLSDVPRDRYRLLLPLWLDICSRVTTSNGHAFYEFYGQCANKKAQGNMTQKTRVPAGGMADRAILARCRDLADALSRAISSEVPALVIRGNNLLNSMLEIPLSILYCPVHAALSRQTPRFSNSL